MQEGLPWAQVPLDGMLLVDGPSLSALQIFQVGACCRLLHSRAGPPISRATDSGGADAFWSRSNQKCDLEALCGALLLASPTVFRPM